MRVQLKAYTLLAEHLPDYIPHDLFDMVSGCDELAEEAGRLDYLSWHRPNEATATNEGYLENIISQGHFSVLEHASATFYIDGVSRNFTHELIRHRHLSFSEVSQRYVDVSKFKCIYPPAVVELVETKGYSFDGDPDQPVGKTDAGLAYEMVVETLLREGLTRKEARQAARYWLPSGLETKMLVTGNLRAWREVLQKRTKVNPDTGKPLADLEFYNVATKILQQLREIAPNTFQDFAE